MITGQGTQTFLNFADFFFFFCRVIIRLTFCFQGTLRYKDSEGDLIDLENAADLAELLRWISREGEESIVHIVRTKQCQWSSKQKLGLKLAVVAAVILLIAPCAGVFAFLPLLALFFRYGGGRSAGCCKRAVPVASQPRRVARQQDAEAPAHAYAAQLAQLRALGFQDTLRNLQLLNEMQGDLNQVVNALVQ